MLSENERRNFPRVTAKCKITYKTPDSDTALQHGEVIDLSAGGVSFQTKQSLPIGNILEASVIPETKITPALNAIIEVKRVSKTDNLYKIAAEIKQIK